MAFLLCLSNYKWEGIRAWKGCQSCFRVPRWFFFFLSNANTNRTNGPGQQKEGVYGTVIVGGRDSITRGIVLPFARRKAAHQTLIVDAIQFGRKKRNSTNNEKKKGDGCHDDVVRRGAHIGYDLPVGIAWRRSIRRVTSPPSLLLLPSISTFYPHLPIPPFYMATSIKPPDCEMNHLDWFELPRNEDDTQKGRNRWANQNELFTPLPLTLGRVGYARWWKQQRGKFLPPRRVYTDVLRFCLLLFFFSFPFFRRINNTNDNRSFLSSSPIALQSNVSRQSRPDTNSPLSSPTWKPSKNKTPKKSFKYSIYSFRLATFHDRRDPIVSAQFKPGAPLNKTNKTAYTNERERIFGCGLKIRAHARAHTHTQPGRLTRGFRLKRCPTPLSSTTAGLGPRPTSTDVPPGGACALAGRPL